MESFEDRKKICNLKSLEKENLVKSIMKNIFQQFSAKILSLARVISPNSDNKRFHFMLKGGEV